MLEGRSMYVWRLARVLGASGVDAVLQKAADHKISSLWVKIADGGTRFENVETNKPWAAQLHTLVTKAHAAQMTVYGYHVPHCANVAAANTEVQFIAGLLAEFSLDGVVIDNEEGSSYFQGGPNEAKAYGKGLQQALAPANRYMVMSSHDIVSAHPGAQAAIIANYITVNGPQVYYGQSPSVQSRLDHAIADNAAFHVPFVPVGALFIREPGKSDGGCANEDQCAQRARDFITLVSARHQAFPQKYPGYGFWNWEEAPAKAWDVLKSMPVFV